MKNKPWFNQHGKRLSDEELKEVSRCWNQTTWEEYLQTLETPLREKLIEPKLYDELAARQDETIFQKFCITPNPESQRLVQRLLDQLSPKQRYILEQTYFEGKPERQIADSLDVSKPSIHKRKKTALSHLYRLMTEGGSAMPYIGEHVLNPKDPFQKIDEYYQEGSLSQDERNHLWALAELGGIKEGDLS